MDDYYETNAVEYNASTVQIDPGSFLQPLAKRLAVGATILDIGCGSGRDMRWFKERGFRPTGFERSSRLAEMAQSHSGCPVIEADFETYDFSGLAVDAILLVGALVHIPHHRFILAFQSILRAVVPGGYALLTLKEGQNLTETCHSRTFYLWQDSDLRSIFEDLNLKLVRFSRDVSKVRNTDIWLGYLLRLEKQY